MIGLKLKKSMRNNIKLLATSVRNDVLHFDLSIMIHISRCMHPMEWRCCGDVEIHCTISQLFEINQYFVCHACDRSRYMPALSAEFVWVWCWSFHLIRALSWIDDSDTGNYVRTETNKIANLFIIFICHINIRIHYIQKEREREIESVCLWIYILINTQFLINFATSIAAPAITSQLYRARAIHNNNNNNSHSQSNDNCRSSGSSSSQS